MTRETKVGLLVGLGIILLVGIIVSDHLSVAQRQQAADLTKLPDRARLSVSTPSTTRVTAPVPDPSEVQREQPVDQEVTRPRGQRTYAYDQSPRRSVAQHGRTSPQPSRSPQTTNIWRAPDPSEPHLHEGRSLDRRRHDVTPSPRPVNLVTAERSQANGQADHARPEYALASEDEPPVSTSRKRHVSSQLNSTVSQAPQALSPMIHEVQAGESLWVIAQRYYDNGGYWKRIADANHDVVGSDGTVREGIKLVIPDHAGRANRAKVKDRSKRVVRRSKRGQADSDAANTRSRRKRVSQRTVVVEDGDTLSSIAQQYMGSGNRWPSLYKANRDRLANPDAVRAGQVLRLPND